MLIDSHCHLDYFALDDLPCLLARAQAAGVEQMITIGTSLAKAEQQFALAERWPQVWCSIGTHPHHAAEQPLPAVKEIVALAAHRRCVGIGEAGLDYFYDKSPREEQQAAFRVQAKAAAAAGLPLIIHSRDADEDTIRILREEFAATGGFPLLLHCFSSGCELAEAALGLGGYISFSGILTFAKSQVLREIARAVPADRLLVETDAPFLAPVPHRGKRNEPAFVVETARVLASLRGLDEGALSELTTANCRRLFAKMEQV